VAELAATNPGQVHTFPSAETWFMYLDVTSPPFSDPRVRQALNYAIDRERLSELAGGLGSPTCQILPPNYPGYQPYCPYTLRPSTDGSWEAPDLARAQLLAEAADTAGTSVTVWTSPILANGAGQAVAQHVTEVLDQLGFEARLHVERDFGVFVDAALAGEQDLQIYLAAWFSDYPKESGFIPVQFECQGAANLIGFCDPELDRNMERARQLEVTDPAGARALWIQVERRIVDQAPVVPLFNLPIVHLVSERVGNYQAHPQWTVLIDQLWVR
jgi:peptide/nickel transport system substrate-binding protein